MLEYAACKLFELCTYVCSIFVLQVHKITVCITLYVKDRREKSRNCLVTNKLINVNSTASLFIFFKGWSLQIRSGSKWYG
jgi:hypothetical protein